MDCNHFFNPQRRSGKASSDVQILKIDEDLSGSTTEYMKVQSQISVSKKKMQIKC